MNVRNVVAALMLAFSGSMALGGTPKSDVSALLFPETMGWTSAQGLTRASESLLRKYEGQLKANYLESSYAKGRGDTGADDVSTCSFITRAFSKDFEFPAGFYINDLNGDRLGDVIYTGSEHCSEGDITIIWVGGPNGYTLKTVESGLMLRLHTGKVVGLSLVNTGCCADPMDRYRVVNAPGISGTIEVKGDTTFPAPDARRVSFVSNAEMAVRSSPDVKDDYVESASRMNGQAVFGNIMARYMPGATGYLIGLADENRKGWCFGILSEDSDALRLSVSYSSHAGWFECEKVKIVQGQSNNSLQARRP